MLLLHMYKFVTYFGKFRLIFHLIDHVSQTLWAEQKKKSVKFYKKKNSLEKWMVDYNLNFMKESVTEVKKKTFFSLLHVKLWLMNHFVIYLIRDGNCFKNKCSSFKSLNTEKERGGFLLFLNYGNFSKKTSSSIT